MSDGAAGGGDGAAGQAAAGGESVGQAVGESVASESVAGESTGQGEASEASEASKASEINKAAGEVKSEETKTEAPEAVEKAPEIAETNKLLAKFKKLFPDNKFENDDAIRDHIASEYDGLSDYKTKNLEANKVVLDVFKTVPELGNVIKEVTKGVPFNVALAMHVDMDTIAPKEGDVDYTAYSDAMKGKITKMKESETQQENITKNQEVSRKVIKDFFDSKKMDEAQVNEFAEFMDGIFAKVNDGTIDADVLSHFYNAKNFTSQIETEKEVAEIKGKNENIDLKKEDKKVGDGLPNIGQGESKTTEKAVEKGVFDDMFAKQTAKQNIYK